MNIINYIKHKSRWGILAIVTAITIWLYVNHVDFYNVDLHYMTYLLNSLKNNSLTYQQLLKVVPVNTLSAQHQIIQISEIYKFSIPDSEMLYQCSKLANQPRVYFRS
jgi:hypothetical protein